MTSRRVERTWIRTGGYGRFRGEWVKVDSEYLRFSFKVKVDYFILYSILVYSFVIFLIFFSMNKRSRMFEASLLN